MKKISFFWLVSILMLLPICFVSCSDDDEESVGSASNLIGLWDPVHAEGYEIYDGKKDTWNENINAESEGSDYARVEFFEDGTCTRYIYYKGSWVVDDDGEGVYQVKGNKLYIVSVGDADEDDSSTIVKLTSNQLIIERRDIWKNGDEVEEYYEKITSRKIR